MTAAILIIAGSLLAQVIAHEAAHAVAMRRNGIRVEEAGIGFWRPRLAFRWRDVLWTLSPWLLGAYVSAPEGTDLTKLKWRPMTWILNSGIVVNLITGTAFLTALAAVNGRWTTFGVMLVLTTTLIACRYEVAAYVVPALGPIALGWLLFILAGPMLAGAPTGFAATAPLAEIGVSPAWVLEVNAGIGLGLALLNAAPLGATDNGQVWNRILRDRFGERASTVYLIAGLAVLAVLLGYAVIRDLLSFAL